MRISDWSSDVCSSDLGLGALRLQLRPVVAWMQSPNNHGLRITWQSSGCEHRQAGHPAVQSQEAGYRSNGVVHAVSQVDTAVVVAVGRVAYQATRHELRQAYGAGE